MMTKKELFEAINNASYIEGFKIARQYLEEKKIMKTLEQKITDLETEVQKVKNLTESVFDKLNGSVFTAYVDTNIKMVNRQVDILEEIIKFSEIISKLNTAVCDQAALLHSIEQTMNNNPNSLKHIGKSEPTKEQQEQWDIEDKRAEIKRIALEVIKVHGLLFSDYSTHSYRDIVNLSIEVAIYFKEHLEYKIK